MDTISQLRPNNVFNKASKGQNQSVKAQKCLL